MRIALADHAEKTMRFEIGSGQLTDLAGGHKERAADIASLPLHPVGLGRVENVVAIADLHARIRVAFQQVRARRLQIPQIGVESDMSVFMGECRAQAVLPVLIPSQGSRDPQKEGRTPKNTRPMEVAVTQESPTQSRLRGVANGNISSTAKTMPPIGVLNVAAMPPPVPAAISRARCRAGIATSCPSVEPKAAPTWMIGPSRPTEPPLPLNAANSVGGG